MKIIITENQLLKLTNRSLLNEDFKSQKQKFISQGFDESIVDEYMNFFKEIKDKKYKAVFDNINGVSVTGNNRINIDAYKTFRELEVVVDYVRGQTRLSGAKIAQSLDIDAKPIFENDDVSIYYASSAHHCITYRGNVPYSWCVAARGESNMYSSYRYREHEPAFYFVKLKKRTKKELGALGLLKSSFKGSFDDPYHFFVVQVEGRADVDDRSQVQYIVTSANNDGEKEMSWDDIVDIDENLDGLQKIFKPVPHTYQERKDYNEFKNGVDDDVYCKLPMERKRTYLDIAGLKIGLNDKKWQCSPYDLKNLYVGFGVNLTEFQMKEVLADDGLSKRYITISERIASEVIDGNIYAANLKPSNYMVLSDKYKIKIIDHMTSNGNTIGDEFYEYTPERLKSHYIEQAVKNNLWLTKNQYVNTSDELKEKYIISKIKSNKRIPDQAYADMSQQLKLEYIKMKVSNGRSLSEEKYFVTPDDLKYQYLQLKKQNNIKMYDYEQEDYDDLMND